MDQQVYKKFNRETWEIRQPQWALISSHIPLVVWKAVHAQERLERALAIHDSQMNVKSDTLIKEI